MKTSRTFHVLSVVKEVLVCKKGTCGTNDDTVDTEMRPTIITSKEEVETTFLIFLRKKKMEKHVSTTPSPLRETQNYLQ